MVTAQWVQEELWVPAGPAEQPHVRWNMPGERGGGHVGKPGHASLGQQLGLHAPGSLPPSRLSETHTFVDKMVRCWKLASIIS